jgi:hypothetical protein
MKKILIFLFPILLLFIGGCMSDEETYTLGIYNISGGEFFAECSGSAISKINTDGTVVCVNVSFSGSNCPNNSMCETLMYDIPVYYENYSEVTGIFYERFDT